MITKRIIPCLDVKDGRVVKGIQFKNIQDVGDPCERAYMYQSQGADELVLLDIWATLENRKNRAALIKSIRKELAIPLCVGGAVQSIEDIETLLKAGADKIAINSAAIMKPGLVDNAARIFGSQCIVVSIDAKRIFEAVNMAWRVVTRSGTTTTTIDALAWAQEVTRRGAGEILLTSLDKDGTRSGYDLELTSSVAHSVGIPVIASGGARSPNNLVEAFHAGADAVLAASLFHIDQISIVSVKKFLKQKNIEVRL